jgi:hypothetical protein
MPKFKSKLEEKVWNTLIKEYPSVQYEPTRIKFTQPVQVDENREIYLEAKGLLDLETRKKMIWFRECNPDIRIIMLFQNASNKLHRGSKTTYAMWAEANNFEWLDFRKDWLNAYRQLCSQ